jgi:iron complex transport system substrate-binding protein
MTIMRHTIIFLTGFLLALPVTAAPERIVSLDLCSDWMLLKYASQSQVLAYSSLLYQYPADWVEQGLPVHNGSLEQITKLKPDLVISGEYNATLLRKRLKQLGFKVEVLPLPHDLDSIQQYSEQFMSIVQSEVPEITFSPMNPLVKKNKSLLLLGANGIATGKGTLEDDILTAAGWDNYSKSRGYINLDLEQLVANPPDAIYYSAPLSNSLANLFAQHIAIKKRVRNNQFMRDENWRWQCPGPWTFDLIQELSQWQGS